MSVSFVYVCFDLFVYLLVMNVFVCTVRLTYFPCGQELLDVLTKTYNYFQYPVLMPVEVVIRLHNINVSL